MQKIIIVMGARPNFMKVAPLIRTFHSDQRLRSNFTIKTVHTGQHSDDIMSGIFLRQLGIDKIDHSLNVGGGSHAEVTAKIMVSFEKVCRQERPDIVLVVGDVNSTLATSITAKKMGIALIHVEAGLRSRNHGMPEEINRLATDAISDLFFTTTKMDVVNLIAEGKDPGKIHFVGNLMIDTLLYHMRKLPESAPGFSDHRLQKGKFCVLTLHRPSNVDDLNQFSKIIEAIATVGMTTPVLFPCHPRTRGMIDHPRIKDLLQRSQVVVSEPLDYVSMLDAYRGAKFFITDSGGIQEETTALGIPCLTIREETERPITVLEGTNTLVGSDMELLLAKVETILKGTYKEGRCPEFWDGSTAGRLWDIILEYFNSEISTKASA